MEKSTTELLTPSHVSIEFLYHIKCKFAVPTKTETFHLYLIIFGNFLFCIIDSLFTQLP